MRKILVLLLLLLPSSAISEVIVYPQNIYEWLYIYPTGEISQLYGVWETATEAQNERDSFGCPSGQSLTTTYNNIEIHPSQGDQSLYNTYRSLCTDGVDNYYHVFAYCQAGDCSQILDWTTVSINVVALEIMIASYLLALAVMWGIRKGIKLMNRS